MPTLTLNLGIDTTDLRIIRGAQERIILAKKVNGETPNVIWQSFSPFEGNQIKWDEDYGIYASTTQIVNGATIFQLSATAFPSQDRVIYPFLSDATFGDPVSDPSVGKGTFATTNGYLAEDSLTFGLFQSATINGKRARCGRSTPRSS